MGEFRVILSVFLLSSVLGYAQEFRATLTGRVVDPSNAAVPNVAVQVKHTGTNEVTAATTDTQGNYTAPLLRPGSYNISVEAPGFKSYTRENFVLNVGQRAMLDIRLEVGALTEQVTVTAVAETPLLETATADRGGIIDEQRVHEFPLNARNPFMLSMLIAGVNYNGNIIYQRPFDNGAIADWSINGSRNRTNEFLLDGAPNNAQAGGNNIAYVPPVDSVQEFKIHTNSYDAQYGKTGGGIINVSLKSGTNAFHGSVYEFARRNAWDANSFQNNSRGAAREGHFLDQFGVQASGPLVIPKLYNGRDRTFWMFNYEGYREGTPNPLTLSVPEMETRDGDFSKLADAQGRKIAIYDPNSGHDVKGQWVRDPFPGNVIPKDRINPIARRISDFFPKPNTVTPGVGYSSQNFFVPGGENVAADNFYNLVFKFDQNVGDRHRLFFRQASNDRTEMRNTNGVHGPGEDGPLPLKRINDAYVLDWVGTLRPTLLVNVRASFGRYIEGSRGDGNKGFDMTTLGFPKSLVSELPHGAYFGRYEVSGYINLGRYFGFNYTNTWAVHPNVTKIRGAHTVKSGVDMRWIQYANKSSGNVFTLSSSRSYTQKDWNRGDALSGNGLATWLIGTPTGGSVAYNLFPIYLYKYVAPWVQDDWKATRKLTLNLGLRWDFNVAPTERFNRMNRSFDPSLANPVDKMADRSKFPELPVLKGGMLFAGVNGVPRRAADLYRRAIQPRFGFAYQLTNKVVARGGWGRYYLNPGNDYFQTSGFNQSTSYISTLDSGRTIFQNTLNNPFPNGVTTPPGASLGPLTFIGRGFNFVNPKFRIPHADQFSFGFQVQLPLASRLEISYVGSRTNDLQTDRAFNEISLADRNKCDLMAGGNPYYCDERVPNPFYGLAPWEGTGTYSSPTSGRTGLWRPMPHFGGLTEVTRNDGRMWYNSMQLVYEIRTRGGLNLIANYTLAKHMLQSGWLDVQQDIMQRSLYEADRPHRFTIGSVYQLPFGKNRRFLSNAHPVLRHVAGGWENTIIFQWQAGTPWSLPGGWYVKDARLPEINWNAPRVSAVRPCVARWNDDNTITLQPFSQQAGCTEYNFLELPRWAPRRNPNYDGRLRLRTAPQADVSLNKMTRITEKLRVQFRAEAFNVTNTFMYYKAQFNNDLQSANFGTLLPGSVGFGSANWPRYIQLAAKLLW